MTLTQPPCHNCTARYIYCHSCCVTWLRWKAEEDRKKELIKREKNIQAGFIESKADRFYRHLVTAKNKRLRGIQAW